MARSFVARQMVKLGGQPIYREGFVTDNGNQIIDIHNLKILDPVELEQKINQIPGVVTNGLDGGDATPQRLMRARPQTLEAEDDVDRLIG